MSLGFPLLRSLHNNNLYAVWYALLQENVCILNIKAVRRDAFEKGWAAALFVRAIFFSHNYLRCNYASHSFLWLWMCKEGIPLGVCIYLPHAINCLNLPPRVIQLCFPPSLLHYWWIIHVSHTILAQHDRFVSRACSKPINTNVLVLFGVL